MNSKYMFDLKYNVMSKKKYERWNVFKDHFFCIDYWRIFFFPATTPSPTQKDWRKRNSNFFKNFKKKKIGKIFVLKTPNENHVKIFSLLFQSVNFIAGIVYLEDHAPPNSVIIVQVWTFSLLNYFSASFI